MDYFLDFENAFWNEHLFVLLKTFVHNRDLVFYLCNHLDKKQFKEEIIKKFTLKRV